MNTKKEQLKLDLEMQTENTHYNNHVVKCVTECIKGQMFETPNEMWRYYNDGVNILIGNESPFDAVCKLMESIKSLTPEQSVFVVERIAEYIKPSETEFDTWDFGMQNNTYKILSCYIENLQKMCELRTPTTSIRNTITKLVQSEIENLPNMLKNLDVKERANIVCKLLPYVVTKSDTIGKDKTEKDNFFSNLGW